MDLMDTLGYNTSLAEALTQAHALTGSWRSLTANLRAVEALTSSDIQKVRYRGEARLTLWGKVGALLLGRWRLMAHSCLRTGRLLLLIKSVNEVSHITPPWCLRLVHCLCWEANIINGC